MQDENPKSEHLILMYLQGKLTTEADMAEWEQWISKEENQKLLAEATNPKLIRQGLAEYYALEGELEPIRQKLIKAYYRGRVVPFHKRKVVRIVAAAAVVLLALGAYWYFAAGNKQNKTPVVQNSDSLGNSIKKSNVIAKNDVSPAKYHASLTLSSGAKIVLDSSKKGVVGWVDNTLFRISNASLTSKNFGGKATDREQHMNTLSTQRAGRFTVKLPDNSVAYLSAESTIRFPSAFSDTVRRVEITGEVYFDVVKLPGKPFKITVNGDAGPKKSLEIQVLGTSFNVKAYKDESVVVTRVVEGSVKIVRGSNLQEIKTLIAGTQATVENGVVKRVDTLHYTEDNDEGYFVFERTTIRDISNELAKWYNLVPEVDDKITNDTYTGTLSRNESLLTLVNKLNTLDYINFYIDGNKLVLKRKE